MLPFAISNFNYPLYLLEDILHKRKTLQSSFKKQEIRHSFLETTDSNCSSSSSCSSSNSSPECSPTKIFQEIPLINENPIQLPPQLSPVKHRNTDQTNFISCVLEATSHQGALFISDFECASDLELLENYNITSVLSIDKNDNFILPNTISHKKIIAFDTELYKIKVHFESCLEFIRTALESKQNVLVHCRRGISRSAAIIIAYFIKHHNHSYKQAHEYLLKRRSIVNPNKGFVSQLIAFEKTLIEYRKNTNTTTKEVRPS